MCDFEIGYHLLSGGLPKDLITLILEYDLKNVYVIIMKHSDDQIYVRSIWNSAKSAKCAMNQPDLEDDVIKKYINEIPLNEDHFLVYNDETVIAEINME